MTPAQLATAYIRSNIAVQLHAATCRRCSAPIVDAEGNPGCQSEACPAGRDLLRNYISLEHDLFSLSPAQRDRALADSTLATLEAHLS